MLGECLLFSKVTQLCVCSLLLSPWSSSPLSSLCGLARGPPAGFPVPAWQLPLAVHLRSPVAVPDISPNLPACPVSFLLCVCLSGPLCPCPCTCPADRFICVVLLDCTYVVRCTFVFLSLTFLPVCMTDSRSCVLVTVLPLLVAA